MSQMKHHVREEDKRILDKEMKKIMLYTNIESKVFQHIQAP